MSDIERLTTKRKLGQELSADEWKEYALILETITRAQAPLINEYRPGQKLEPVRYDPTKLEIPLSAAIDWDLNENDEE